jgi:hypothetical protein
MVTKFTREFILSMKPQVINSIRCSNRRSTRGGWRYKLSKTPVSKMSLPLIASINARSIFTKIDDLKLLLHGKVLHNACVVGIQESWLNGDCPSNYVDIPHFTCFRSDRVSLDKKCGGGLLTYIHSDWATSARVCFSYSFGGIECLSVSCKPKFLPNFRTVIFSNLYIVPQVSPKALNEFLDEYFSTFAHDISDSLFIVAGDLNRINLKPFLLSGLHDIVSQPTRNSVQLDHILINHPESFRSLVRAPLSTADHSIVCALPTVYSPSHYKSFIATSQKVVFRRVITSDRIIALKSALVNTLPLLQPISPTCNLSSYTSNFCNLASSLFNHFCPLEKLFFRNGLISSKHLKRLRRQKERSYKRGLVSEVKELNVKIKMEIMRLKSALVSEMTNLNSAKNVWKCINFVCSRKQNTTSIKVDLDILNSEFICNSPSPPSFYSRFIKPSSSSLLISKADLSCLIQRCHLTVSPGPDGLPPLLLRYCASELSDNILTIINESFSSFCLPEMWRSVCIKPIPKVKSKYRPIASSPVILKLMEKVILKDILPQLSFFSDPLQFAYKRNRSTLDAVASLVHFISSSLDKGGSIVKCVFLDFSSAFLTVDRSSLLEKLHSAGCSASSLSWLADYFSFRTQYTKIGRQFSSTLPCNTGVLQGAVLSPFLFSHYTDGIRASDSPKLFKFADDFAFCSPITSIPEFTRFKNSFNDLISTSSELNLQLNPSKCVTMTFSCRKTIPSRLCDISELPISSEYSFANVECFNYLGVQITSNLGWTSHVEGIFIKLRKLSFSIRKLRHFGCPHSFVCHFVYSCVFPVILYCSPVIFPGLLKKDYCLLKRGLKLISRVSFISFSTLVCRLLEMHLSACSNLCNRILHDDSHPLYTILCSAKSSTQTRSTFRLISARTSTYKNSVIPYLARYLTNSDAVRKQLQAEFSL